MKRKLTTIEHGKRKMAWIAKIDKVVKHPEADSLDICTVGGWQCVTKLGEYKQGDLVVYVSIDSWIPHELAPFLSKGNEPREYNGVKGERLRTIKLRGTLSQGLILPTTGKTPLTGEGDDLTEFLGIQKWEKPIPAQLSGLVRGNFPDQVPKTDQERCLSGDTLLETDLGHLTIKEICDKKIQCYVKSLNHESLEIEMKKIVNHSIMTRRKGWKLIKTKNGKILKVTNNHRIWLPELGCYRNAEELKVGDKLLSS